MEKIDSSNINEENGHQLNPVDQKKYDSQNENRINELWDALKTKEATRQQENRQIIKEQAPVLSEENFLTKSGDYVDFSQAKSIPEIIEQLAELGEIQHGNGENIQTIPAEQIITLIYDRLYNPYADWTKITLRHRLRESIYRLAEDFRKTPDYFNNLNASQYLKATNLNELKLFLEDEVAIPATNGQIMTGSQAIEAIEYGRLDLLPAQLRFKIISLNRHSVTQSNQTAPAVSPAKSPTWRQSLTNTWSSVKSFFSRS